MGRGAVAEHVLARRQLLGERVRIVGGPAHHRDRVRDQEHQHDVEHQREGPIADQQLELARRQERHVQDGPEQPVDLERRAGSSRSARRSRPRRTPPRTSAARSPRAAGRNAAARRTASRGARRTRTRPPPPPEGTPTWRAGYRSLWLRARLAPTMDAMPSPRIILFSSAAFFARPLSQTFRSAGRHRVRGRRSDGHEGPREPGSGPDRVRSPPSTA